MWRNSQAIAPSLLRDALPLRRQAGDRQGEATTLGRIAEALHEEGETGAAAESWRQALAIPDELGDLRADEIRARLATVTD
jgi:hypothetical protein